MKKTELTTLKALLNAQTECAELQTQIKHIDHAIQQQQTTLEAAKIDDSSLAELRAEKELMLANIAIGAGSESDLNALEEKLQAEEEAIRRSTESASKAAKNAIQTIAGLQRKREAVSNELDIASRQLKSTRYRFIAEYAKLKAEDYYKSVEAVAKNLAQLKGIEDMFPAGKDGFVSQTINLLPTRGFHDAVLPKASCFPDNVFPANSGGSANFSDALRVWNSDFEEVVVLKEMEVIANELQALGVELQS